MRSAVPTPKRRQEPTILHELADELEALAVELDRAVLMASPMRGNAFRNRLAHLDLRIDSLEAATQRLGDMVQGRRIEGDVPWEERMRRAEVRLRSYEHAWSELGDVEVHAHAPTMPNPVSTAAPGTSHTPASEQPNPVGPAPTIRLDTPAPTRPLHRFSNVD